MSRKVRREKNLSNIEDLVQRMEGLEKFVDDTLGVRNEEVSNIHHLLGMLKHYQYEFANARNTTMVLNEYIVSKNLKEDFEKWIKAKDEEEEKKKKEVKAKEEEEEKKKKEVKTPDTPPMEAKPNGDIEHVHTA